LPFEGKTATEILAKHVTEPAPAVGSLGVSVPRGVASLIDRCLAKDPEHRPANAQALAEQLGVTLELRREIPVALRAFVKRNARLDGGGTLVGITALATGSVFAASAAGATAGFTTLVVGAAAGSLGYLTLQARRLLALGFDRADVNRAFDAEMTQAREELAVEKATRRARTERVLSLTAKALGTLTAVTAIAALWLLSPMTQAHGVILIAFSTLAPLSILATLGQLVLAQRHRDIDTELWSKLWQGPVGRVAFAIAKKVLRARPATVAITHRATELSLGLAAEQLYESLPKETRRELANLPGVLVRLQADAQALRRDYDELQNALSEAGAAASSDAYDEIRAARDAMHAKLGDAVSALETIRLNLLRLHAGSATVESLTTHLGLAADVSAEVERLIAARRDVESLMRFPREIATTPV
jgi:serine/threonine-protein kinase